MEKDNKIFTKEELVERYRKYLDTAEELNAMRQGFGLNVPWAKIDDLLKFFNSLKESRAISEREKELLCGSVVETINRKVDNIINNYSTEF